MKKLILSIFTVFLLGILAVSAANPIFTSTPVASVQEGNQYTYDVNANDPDGNTPLVFSLVTNPTRMIIDSTTGLITWTPGDSDVGTHPVTVRVTDNNNEKSDQPFVLTVNDVNDVPVLGSIGSKTLFEDATFRLQLTATDPDVNNPVGFGKDVLTFSADLSNLPTGNTATFDSITGLFTWKPDADDIKVQGYDITFNVTDGTETDSETVKLEVFPGFCDEDDEQTNIQVGDIDFSDRDYAIGDEVSITVEQVEADGEDLEDVEVEVFLYNVDEEKEIDSWTSSTTEDLDDGDDADFDVEFTIPNDEDIGEDDEYLLFAVVTADDSDGDSQCFVKSNDDLKIEREKHDVLLSSISVIPGSAKPGEFVEVSVTVENIGTNDEDDVFVRIVNSELGVSVDSNTANIEEFSESDNDARFRTSFKVPDNADEGDYSIEVIAFFDDQDESKSDFVTLTVLEGAPSVPRPTSGNILSIQSVSETGNNAFTISAVVTNDGSDTRNFNLDATASWAQPIASQTITLSAGDSRVVQFLATAASGTAAGSYSGTITAREAGSVVDTESFSVEVSGGEAPKGITGFTVFEGGFGTVGWIIVDIVLVIVAIFFIKLIFSSGKRKKLKAEKVKL